MPIDLGGDEILMDAEFDIEAEASYRSLSLFSMLAAVAGGASSLLLVLVGAPSLAVAHPSDASIWVALYFIAFALVVGGLIAHSSIPASFAHFRGLLAISGTLFRATAFVAFVYDGALAAWINEGAAVSRSAMVVVMSVAPPLCLTATSGTLANTRHWRRGRRAVVAGTIAAVCIAAAAAALLAATYGTATS